MATSHFILRKSPYIAFMGWLYMVWLRPNQLHATWCYWCCTDSFRVAMRYRREFVSSAPLSCHAGSRGPMRMRTNVVYFRVMRRLYRREWNWLCVNQHPWQRTRGHGVWRLTSIAHYAYCISLCINCTRVWTVCPLWPCILKKSQC